ncbi:RBBP9/YdeN family alpha/beta hydrolase [Celerinatantimonas yamalensis]|uniref:Alpha/beta hydrolase n=1 Tax=Celerinatantimonas yamalensis TaxID=559956 RepID=A0ABW9G461_9GAMM
MQQIYLVHGYTASVNSHWFPWLEAQFVDNCHVQFKRIAMPDPNEPKVESWLTTLNQHLQIDHSTILIGHSLGCISLLRFLAQLGQPIHGVLLVAGFAESIATLAELDPFSQLQLPYQQLQEQIKHRVMLYSDNDPVVPAQYSRRLAEQLMMQTYQMSGYGHFLAKEGVSELPLAAQIIHKMLMTS